MGPLSSGPSSYASTAQERLLRIPAVIVMTLSWAGVALALAANMAFSSTSVSTASYRESSLLAQLSKASMEIATWLTPDGITTAPRNLSQLA